MDGDAQRPEVAALIPEVDLNARVVYFPVRHNSPACAWHIDKLIHEIKPDAVLIEGPRDATRLIPLLTHERIRMPVAIYTTYIRGKKSEASRFAAYYPLCDYSPELAAIRAAKDVGARASFIDLTFPEAVEATDAYPDDKVQSLFDEHHLKYSRFLHAACQRAGLRDPDDLWDHLYEDNYKDIETDVFMRNVLAYCALGRQGCERDMLKSDATLAREAAMAAAISVEKGRTVVVTGGFHTVVLPDTKPKMPPKLEPADEDAQVVLVRYTFEQLDRLNGYASGMPSPEFYQRRWEGQDPARMIVELGREIRAKGGDISAEDEISALSHASRLAWLRGHRNPSREDILDGIRSVFVKGSIDVEGAFVLSITRTLLAGNRVGDVPEEAGQPPIVVDFRTRAQQLNLSLDFGGRHESVLDIYRNVRHRETSRFFHRLRFLDVPFGDWVKGPDFVKGENLDRIQEVWDYRWSPGTESTLVERSVYGPTLEEASSALLLERLKEAENEGQGRRADVAAMLLLEACRMGLHKHTQDLLQRTGVFIAEDASFVSLTKAVSELLLLHVSREPLEAHHLTGIVELAELGFERACYLLPGIASVPDEQEFETIDAMNAFCELPERLENTEDLKELMLNRLNELAATTTGNAAVRGAACGLLYGEGMLSNEELMTRLRGHMVSAKNGGEEGVSFLRGLLKTSRSILWQVPEVIESVSEILSEWDEDTFVGRLPDLRLAFSDLTPRECDRVAKSVAEGLGIKAPQLLVQQNYSEAEVMYAVELNRKVIEILERDGLGDYVG